MGWLMPRMLRAVPYLGYVVIAATKRPATLTSAPATMTDVVHQVDALTSA
jgi:hypothetical protein